MPVATPPECFLALLDPIETLEGISKKEAFLLEKACGGNRISDLLFSLPLKRIDRGNILSVAQLSTHEEGEVVTIFIKILSIKRPATKHKPWKLICGDETGEITVSFFGRAPFSLFTIGNQIVLSGKIHFFNQTPFFSNPEQFFLQKNIQSFPWIEPVWPLTAGLTPKIFLKAITSAIKRVENLPEWHDPTLLKKKNWLSFSDSLRCLHMPSLHREDPNKENLFRRALERLQSDEILAHQVCIHMAQLYGMRRKGQSLSGDGHLQKEFLKKFGHEPTPDQKRAIHEINHALQSSYPMQHLLQGDVGSGKTFVAFMAMLNAIEAGAQAAIMAPTEILAQQHFQEALKFSPIEPFLLTGKMRAQKKRNILEAIKNGKARFIVGTHALFQKDVFFENLGLAVIDEQHRFGVEQRIALGKKNKGVNLLLMSATPIPRSVQLMRWGQMGVSLLLQRPAGRGKITTTIHNIENGIEKIKQSLKRAIAAGRRIYWVCPAVEESDISSAVKERYEDLKSFLGENNVGLAHGQQAKEDQEKALQDFREGKIKLLVATTLIEVGVNVPEATVMIIEDAQRFGLAQLHQLRGRIGRGHLDSHCLLLYRSVETINGKERLSLLRETLDGFRIAEADYKQRGGGEVTGTRQSGLPDFRLSQGIISEHLITQSSQEALLILQKDPKLESERGAAVRGLMYLFRKASPETILLSG